MAGSRRTDGREGFSWMQFAGMEAERFCTNGEIGVDEDAQKLADFVRFRAFFEGKTPEICLAAGGRGIWAGAAGGAFRVRRG